MVNKLDALRTVKVHQMTRRNAPNYAFQESSIVKTDCLVGIEIELEKMMGGYERYVNSTCSRYWDIIGDGSLRDGGREFVLKRPYSPAGISTALKGFDKFIKDVPTKPEATQTTSVHIHFDVSEMSVYDYLKFISLYYLFEDALVRSCGEYRYGNLYCLTNQQAPGVFDYLRSIVRDPSNLRRLPQGALKYGALNLAATSSYNSLEFRSMGGSTSGAEIIEWINILGAIKMYAQGIESLHEVLATASMDVKELVHDVFGNNAGRVLENFNEQVFWDTCVDIQYIFNDLD